MILVSRFLEPLGRKGFASGKWCQKWLVKVEGLVSASACEISLTERLHKLLLLTGVPGPALSSLRGVGLSLAFIDSLEGTLDPASVVISNVPIYGQRMAFYLHYQPSSLHALLSCLQRRSLVTVTVWPIVLKRLLCASEPAPGKAAFRIAMLLAGGGRTGKR